MQKYGVFGNPIKHSLSPIIHTQFAKQAGINIDYQKILAPINKFDSYAHQFIKQGASGFNITAPFKFNAFTLATELTHNAKISQAVNTIKLNSGKIIGENTDGIGLINDLTQNLNIKLKNQTILILGAGGAASSIILPLLKQQTKLIMIANRTVSNAVKLAKHFSLYGEVCGFGIEAIKHKPIDIIINATSSLPNIPTAIINNTICYDLMYDQQSSFIELAKANNAKMVVNGIGMLVEQAAGSFKFWTGVKPNTKKVLSSLKSSHCI